MRVSSYERRMREAAQRSHQRCIDDRERDLRERAVVLAKTSVFLSDHVDLLVSEAEKILAFLKAGDEAGDEAAA